MDPAPALGCSLQDVKWSSVAVPLDLLVSTYRLPQIARLDSGECAGARGGGAGAGRGPGAEGAARPALELARRCRSAGAALPVPQPPGDGAVGALTGQ